jgi:predicted O-methyltransferase YrrM
MKDLLTVIEENPYLLYSNSGHNGTDKHSLTAELGHDYVRGFYNEEFKKYADKEIRLLEIGVYTGASLGLWQKYFLKGQIVGLEKYEGLIQEKYTTLDRVTLGICNAYDPRVAEQLGTFDIIIDDGSHELPDLKTFIELYLPLVNEGGLLILEDIAEPGYFQELTEVVPEEYKNNIECLDLRKNIGRFDDLLMIIRK